MYPGIFNTHLRNRQFTIQYHDVFCCSGLGSVAGAVLVDKDRYPHTSILFSIAFRQFSITTVSSRRNITFFALRRLFASMLLLRAPPMFPALKLLGSGNGRFRQNHILHEVFCKN